MRKSVTVETLFELLHVNLSYFHFKAADITLVLKQIFFRLAEFGKFFNLSIIEIRKKLSIEPLKHFKIFNPFWLPISVPKISRERIDRFWWFLKFHNLDLLKASNILFCLNRFEPPRVFFVREKAGNVWASAGGLKKIKTGSVFKAI